MASAFVKPEINPEEAATGTLQAQTSAIIAEEHDEDDGDSTLGSDSDSFTTSLASSVLDYSFENGRRYHKFREGRYVFPNDDAEQDREDLKHAMVMELTGGVLHYAPIANQPQRVLDVGTGTGIWAIDSTWAFPPSAEQTGFNNSHPAHHVASGRAIPKRRGNWNRPVSSPPAKGTLPIPIPGEEPSPADPKNSTRSPIQPKWVPANVRFVVDDCESEWVYPKDHFDFVHGRHLAVAIRDWKTLLKQSYDHVKPGGYAEFQEILVFLESDDDTLPHDATLRQYYRYLDSACTRIGVDMHAPSHLVSHFRDAGFEDVQEKVFKIPLGTWPRDPRLKRVGLFQRTNFLDGLQGISLKPHTAVLGWSMEELEVWLTEVRRAIRDPKTHSFYYMFFVYGRKPEVAGRGA